MMIEFIVGVSVLAHDVVIQMVWMDDKHSINGENKIPEMLPHVQVEIRPQHNTGQDPYPVGFVITKAPL
jgi:hypothetical protein